MPKPTPYDAAWDSFENLAARLIGSIHVGFGIVLLVGGPQRVTLPTWQPILDMTHGTLWPWALLWLASGFLMMAGNRSYTMIVGLVLSVLSCNVWAWLILVATLKYPNVSPISVVAYGGYGLLSALILGYVITRRRPTSKPREG